MVKSKDRWSALSMLERADLIKLYVSNGVTSLDEIRRDYNSFSDGGNTEPIYYDDTYIEPAVVKAFKSQEDYNRFLGEKGARAVRKGTNRVAQNIFKGLQYAPIIGDAIDISDAAISAKDGDYKKAGMLAGLTLIPNALEKPIKALGKGVKNLRIYNRYTKDANRFRDAVNYSLDKYVKRADLLNENYGGTPKKRVLNSAEDVKNTAYNNPISTDFRLTSLFPFIGGKYNPRTDEIWLNKYRPKLINTAWKDPKVAIKRLEESAVHEGTHLALNHLGDNISIKGERYPIANPNHPLYDRVGYAFADPNRKSNTWARNPEELIANMTRASYNLNLDPNLNVRNWDIKNKNRLSNYLSKAHYFTPEDALFIAEELSDFGYKYGGKLNKFATGGPVGDGQKTYNHPKYNHTEEKDIYSYLRYRGVPHIQSAAIMGNIAVESMLDPHISQIGGGGGYGLIQATDKARKDSFINYDGQPYEFGSKLDPETQRQLDYIVDKGLNTYTTGEWKKVKGTSGARDARKKFLSETNVNKASNLFRRSYLRPGKPHSERRQSMSAFYNEKYTNPFENEYNNAFLFK
jgi:hypothetical protein